MEMNKRNRLSEQEIKKVELDALLYIRKICQQYHLRYYLAWGTLLGAVRHKGFIPWDDDIDVFMPRKDFKLLQQLWNEEMKDTQYRFWQSNESCFLRSLISYISDEKTTFIKERQQDLEVGHGVRLEILPIDGCPSSRNKKKISNYLGTCLPIICESRTVYK